MRKWIDYVAILALAFVGLIGSVMVNQAVPIPDAITLILFGAGIISSITLLKTKYLLNIGKPPTFLRNRTGSEEERESKNEVFRLRRSPPRW